MVSHRLRWCPLLSSSPPQSHRIDSWPLISPSYYRFGTEDYPLNPNMVVFQMPSCRLDSWGCRVLFVRQSGNLRHSCIVVWSQSIGPQSSSAHVRCLRLSSCYLPGWNQSISYQVVGQWWRYWQWWWRQPGGLSQGAWSPKIVPGAWQPHHMVVMMSYTEKDFPMDLDNQLLFLFGKTNQQMIIPWCWAKQRCQISAGD